MIVTDLEQLSHQVQMTPGFQTAIDFLKGAKWKGLPVGRAEVDGARVYVLVQEYDTRVPDNNRLEAHRRYIDIQYVAEGSETIRWAPADNLAPSVPYDQTKDVWFGTKPQDETIPVLLTAGQLAVFFPSDGHAPGLVVGVTPAHVRKLVVKVAVADDV